MLLSSRLTKNTRNFYSQAALHYACQVTALGTVVLLAAQPGTKVYRSCSFSKPPYYDFPSAAQHHEQLHRCSASVSKRQHRVVRSFDDAAHGRCGNKTAWLRIILGPPAADRQYQHAVAAPPMRPVMDVAGSAEAVIMRHGKPHLGNFLVPAEPPAEPVYVDPRSGGRPGEVDTPRPAVIRAFEPVRCPPEAERPARQAVCIMINSIFRCRTTPGGSSKRK